MVDEATPQRIQRMRTKGWRMPEGAVYVGRPGVFGNPFDAKRHGIARAVRLHRAWLEDGHVLDVDPTLLVAGMRDFRRMVLERMPMLRGRSLCCWCGLNQPCHADVLLELANG